MSQIAFDVSAGTYFNVTKAARLAGFRTIGEFMKVETERIYGGAQPSVDNRPAVRVNEKVILEALRERPMTLRQVCVSMNKLYPVLLPVLHSMVGMGWVAEHARDVWTGGRPGVSYKITELGLQRLDAEAARVARLTEETEKAQELQRLASAQKNPDRKRMRVNDTSTPEGAWTQAALDALYAVVPALTDDQIAERVNDRIQDVKNLMTAYPGATTWEQETETLKLEGWIA